MKGLLYKELLQNRTNLLYFLYPVLLIIGLCIAMLLTGERTEPDTEATANIITLAATSGYAALFFVLDNFKINFLRADESHKWAHCVISLPNGDRAYVYTKYLFVFFVNLALLTLCTYCDFLLTTISGTVISASLVAFLLFCCNLLLAALELPFLFRYSAKFGEKINTVIFLSVVFVGVVYALFGDLSMFGSMEDLFDALLSVLDKAQSGDLPDGVYLFLGLFPCVSLGLYIASYHLSCKWFKKGVQFYEK